MTWIENIENYKKSDYNKKQDELCLIKTYAYIIHPPCTQEVCTETEPKKTSNKSPTSTEKSNTSTKEGSSWKNLYTVAIVLTILAVAGASTAACYFRLDRVCVNYRRPQGSLYATFHCSSDQSNIHCEVDPTNEERNKNQIP